MFITSTFSVIRSRSLRPNFYAPVILPYILKNISWINLILGILVLCDTIIDQLYFVQTILKKPLDLRKVCARWVPHLLTEEQKTQRLKCARELLKTYKGCNSQIISNLLTGDETWVHMFEPQRRAEKRTISSKKMYAIFFNSSGPVVQVPCPSGHTVTGRFYKNSVLKKVKEFYNEKRPSKGWSGVHLLHDNASSHKCEVVKSFLASEKVEVLNHPPYSPDLSPCDFFLFPRLKKMLSGNKYTSRSSLGSAIYQCLQQIPKEKYLSAFRD